MRCKHVDVLKSVSTAWIVTEECFEHLDVSEGVPFQILYITLQCSSMIFLDYLQHKFR